MKQIFWFNKNLRKLKKLTNSKIYPVVKADAYGHGLKMVVESIDPLISDIVVYLKNLEQEKLQRKILYAWKDLTIIPN